MIEERWTKKFNIFAFWIIVSLTITIGPLHVHIIQKSERNTLFSKIPWVDMVGTICMQGLLKWIKDDGDVWNERHDEWSYYKSK